MATQQLVALVVLVLFGVYALHWLTTIVTTNPLLAPYGILAATVIFAVTGFAIAVVARNRS